MTAPTPLVAALAWHAHGKAMAPAAASTQHTEAIVQALRDAEAAAKQAADNFDMMTRAWGETSADRDRLCSALEEIAALGDRGIRQPPTQTTAFRAIEIARAVLASADTALTSGG